MQKTILEYTQEINTPFSSTVGNYSTTNFSCRRIFNRRPKPTEIELNNFGTYSDNALIVFDFGDSIEQLVLHRCKTLLNFLGNKKISYDLINFAESLEGTKLKWLFPQFDPYQERVRVTENEKEITIAGLFFTLKFPKT